MANEIHPLRPSILLEEHKQVNKEDYKEQFDKAREEVARLTEANKGLLVSNEKLTRKLEKKKNELQAEKTSLLKYQLQDEMKIKGERRSSQSIASFITEDYVEKLVMENTGLESELAELKRENLRRSNSVPANNQFCLQQEIQQLRSQIHSQDVELRRLCDKCQKLNDDCHGQQRFIDRLSHEKKQLQEQLGRESNFVAKWTHDYQQERFFASRQEEKCKHDKAQMTDEIRKLELLTESLRQKHQDQMLDLNEQVVTWKIKVHDLTEVNGEFETNKQNSKIEITKLEEQLFLVKAELHILKASARYKEEELIKENTQLKSDLEKLQKPPGAARAVKTANLTPVLAPISNPTGTSATKVTLKSGKVANIIKLKALPFPMDMVGNQVICIVNKCYELGILKTIFDMEPKSFFSFGTAKYVGIQFFSPIGNSGGEYLGKQHFECEAKFGHFLPHEEVFVPVH